MNKPKQNINYEMIIQRDKQINRLEQILRDIAIILYSVGAYKAERPVIDAESRIEELIMNYFHPNVHFKVKEQKDE